jgi:hypothetical protein
MILNHSLQEGTRVPAGGDVAPRALSPGCAEFGLLAFGSGPARLPGR